MKEFLQLMRRFVSPYKKYIGWAVLLNILSAVFNVFSFTFLIPILSILFKTEGADKVYHFMEWGSGDLADVAKNNFYYYISQMIIDNGPTMALIFLGLFLMIMTLFKTGCYFASSAVMIPLRTGVVRDIRIMVYAKVMRLPMSFFSEERKGDIIARMSGDVGEVENSITSSLDMLMKSPIMIILYFATLVITSWQLTLYDRCVAGNGLADGCGRTKTETPVFGGAEQVERYDVATGRNVGWLAHYQSFYCGRQND